MLLKRKNKDKKELDKNRLLTIVGSLIFIIGVLVYAGNLYYSHFLDLKESDLIEEFFDNQKEEIMTEVNIDEDGEEVETNNISYNYVGVLEIPKINVKRGFLSLGDRYNTVSRNVEVIEQSDMPDVVNGNLILAAHSGSGRVAYFKNVYKLTNDDKVIVYYGNKKYTYEVTDKYEVEKTGKVLVSRDKDTTTLTLITCSQTDKTKQIVVISKLVEEVDYE